MDDEKKKICVRINNKEINVDERAQIPTIELPDEQQKDVPANVIDFAKKKKEKRNIEPFWDDGNRDKIPKIPHNDRKKKRRKTIKFTLRNLPITFIIATLSAILVGISLGITVLSLMTDSRETNLQFEEQVSTTETNDDLMSLVEMENYIVQGGAFSTFEKGKEMATILQDRGQAGVLVSNSEHYYLFIGIGHSKESAEKISKIYNDSGFETYVKTHKVGNIKATIPEEIISYVNKGVELHGRLTETTVGALTEGTKIDHEIIDDVRSWSEEIKNVKLDEVNTVNKETKGKIIDYHLHIKDTATYLSQYEENPVETTLWLAQQKLLEAIVSYEQIVASLKS